MPESTRIKITLFVHDLKAPLAVIDLGVRSLKERQKTHGPLTHDQENALDKLSRQTQSLRREVDRALSGEQGAKSSPVGGVRGMLKRLISGTSRPEERLPGISADTKPPDVPRELLTDIEARLHQIGQTVDLLEKEAAPGALTDQQARVFGRLKRSVKLSLILIGNAELLAFPRERENQSKSVLVRDAIRRPLVEIFDLYNWQIADQLESFTAAEDLTGLVAEAGLTLQIEPGLLDRQYVLDSDKIRQILVNLLLNAFKFRRETVCLAVQVLDQNLVFSVSDDGRGMAEDVFMSINKERFVAGQDTDFFIRSHGIGLAGARLLTEEMGGELAIESSAGEGTKILVTLPCIQARRLKAED